MNKIFQKIFILFFCFIATTKVYAENLRGDQASACEVLLCLSGGLHVAECQSTLKKFFKSLLKNPLNLKLCPTAESQIKDVERAKELQNMNKKDLKELEKQFKKAQKMDEYTNLIKDYNPNHCIASYLNSQYDQYEKKELVPHYYNGKVEWVEEIVVYIRVSPNINPNCQKAYDHEFTGDLPKPPKYKCSGVYQRFNEWTNRICWFNE